MEEYTAASSIRTDGWDYLRPQPLSYYLHAGKARQKIGSVATKSFFQIKEFIHKDISRPAHSVTSSVSGLITKSFSRQADNPEKSAQKDKDDDEESKQENVEKEFDEAVKQSNEVLAEATTVFPFTLFPDTLTVDRTKLTITQRTFFMSSKVMTIHIEDVLNLSVQVGPLFGSLTIALKGLTSEDHISMNYFWRKDAIHLKHIIQGHTIARRDKLDYKSMDRKKLVETLMQLGKDSNA
jgi:hypothetical protein